MAQWPVVGAAVVGRGPNRFTLSSGQVWIIPQGVWSIRPGNYGSIQQRDPVTGIWYRIGGGFYTIGGAELIYSDGVNYRVANQTGCAVGALLTTAGSGYTSAPTVTPSAGGSIWRAIVGGALNTSVTVTNAGLNYTYPPIVLIDSPGPGGVQATATCTLSSNTVASVTMDNQGAGYTSPPQITFINDPRELNPASTSITTGYGAAAVATLTGAQTVTAVICTDHGQGGLTSLPTLAFAGGGGSSAAATAIMCWSITAYAVTSGGTGWTTAPFITAMDAFPTTSAAYANPQIHKGLVAIYPAFIIGAVSAGAITATGQIVNNGGIYTAVPTIIVQNSGILITATAALTATMGGQATTIYTQQM
jgi:hypothetical protein